MTDYEMTEKFLVSLGIDYEKDQSDYKNNEVILRLTKKGYTRFICEFYFDVGGNFIEIGIWE